MMKKSRIAALAAVSVFILSLALGGCSKAKPVQTPYDDGVAYAESVKNTVSWQCLYEGKRNNKTGVLLKNKDVILTLPLNGEHVFSSMHTHDGKELIQSSDLCAVAPDGREYRVSSGTTYSRMNVYRHGLYYADMHIMNNQLYCGEELNPALFERTFHTYGDKIHETVTVRRIRENEPIEKLFVELKLDGELLSGDGYAAVKLKNGWIVGYILPKDGVGVLESEVSDSAVTLRLCAGQALQDVDSFTFGARLFYGTSEEELNREVYVEQHPIEGILLSENTYASDYVGYDPLAGYYRFNIEGSNDFNMPYYENPDYRPELDFTINAEDDRNLYVMLHTDAGTLECAALMTGEGDMLPVNVQSGKNFCGEFEEPQYYPGDPSYGESIVPLRAKSGESLSYKLIQMYQNWGKTPLKQLSSIQFFVPYYHLSVGVTETTCFCMNFFTKERDGYFLPDFRGLSGEIWNDQPQFDSAGHTYLTDYLTDKSTKSVNYMRYTGSNIASAGPVYTDVTMNFLAHNGDAKLSYRAIELPQTDENRNFVTIELEFLNDVTIENARERLRFMRFDTRFSLFQKFGYLAADGSDAEVAVSSLDSATTYPLGRDQPYMAFYDILPSEQQLANVGLVITNSEITVGGKSTDVGFVVGFDPSSNCGWFSLDADTLSFQAGDKIVLDFILMPYGKQINTAAPLQKLRADACDMLFRTQASDNRAEFTLEKGVNNVVLRAEGFTDYRLPTITCDGQPFELSSGKGYADGYQVYVNENGLYDFAFAIDAETYMGKTFLLTQETKPAD